MSTPPRIALLMLAITLIAGAGGGWIGVHYGLRQAAGAEGLDELLHRQLRLSAAQQQQLIGIEAAYARDRIAPEQQMRLANHELVAALTSEHRYGPAAQRAITHFHQAMQTLQEDTIQHILAMRAVLTPAQTRQFDRAIAEAIDSDQP